MQRDAGKSTAGTTTAMLTASYGFQKLPEDFKAICAIVGKALRARGLAPEVMQYALPVAWESDGPDIQFHFAALTAETVGAKTHEFPGFTFSVCQLRPSSRGSIHLRSLAQARRRSSGRTT